jgi:hypothetical protein
MSKPLRQCITAFGKAKKTFKTFEDAVAWAKRMNEDSRTIHKQIAYKCRSCLKFHVGKNPHNILLVHKINIYEQNK